MTQELNIVELIENNPITKLSTTYNNKLLSKIKNNFTGFEQQTFISSFYCFLNYDKTTDFVINLDNVWKWLGFNQKVKAIRLLEKYFKADIDYKNLAFPIGKASSEEETPFKADIDHKNLALQFGKASSEEEEKSLLCDSAQQKKIKTAFPIGKAVSEEKNSIAHVGKQDNKEETALPNCKADSKQEKNINIKKDEKWGGHNKQTIMLNIKCFKSFCLKSQTKKASEIHEYYMKMEETLHETLEEETDELKLQLQKKDNTISEIKQSTEQEKLKLKKDKYKAVEKAISSQFPVNTECIYFGTIDNTNDKNEQLIKFGHTNDLTTRLYDHHNKYDNFVLQEAFKVQNKVEIENLIKTYPKIKKHIRTIEVKGKSKTEIIAYDNTYFTIARLSKYIKDIIHSKTYSIDNFNRIMKLNDDLENENTELRENIKNLNEKINNQGVEINQLKELIERQDKSLKLAEFENVSEAEAEAEKLPKDQLSKRFDEFISTECVVRKDAEVDSCEIIAQFRIWNKIKPKRETNERFNTYLKTRFLATRLQNQTKDQCVHGFVGVMLKSIEYKKSYSNDLTENFIFETCRFSSNNRIPTNKLHDEFLRYKNKMGITITSTELTDIKTYLNSSPHVLKGTLYIQEDKFTYEGYYGLALKTDNPNIRKTTSVTGKKVQKIDINTKVVLNNWDTIAKAAIHENISAAKMSRSIKNKVVFGDYFYA